ncbi:uncharacterized protein PHALS_00810 [Plasmopara halstedii]|uniref:Uncharacterized protein n=1 Tax=Plasmopara halstedii TaxID=4781 RepID=A0A0N7L6J4_PLAHL|nr:uncharacterized protein PHALS_00810 [Plasmopara halstedii]CEG44443.1 hypothetical protein PHALS_00810 [Plasmopara halstedii]|eukprot:XP_024580812.1 hypothetical protein PHALS_00810 [Plasmopara halstedii]
MAPEGSSFMHKSSSPAPILLSPISVAHRSQMIEADEASSIRDKWMANLQKKRSAAAEGTGAPIGNGNRSASGSQTNYRSHPNSRNISAKKSSRSRSAASRAVKNRNAAQLAYEKSLLAHRAHLFNQDQLSSMSSSLIVDSQVAMNEFDVQANGQPSMLFNESNYFDHESPSFSQFISSSFDDDSPLAFSDSAIKENSRSKRTTKASSKKRPTYSLAVEVDPAKPRTPRRKLNSGSTPIDDFDLNYCIPTEFPGVGTPSNFRFDPSSMRHLWGHDLDISNGGGYADSFLDIPTPRLAEIPLVPTSNQTTHSIGGVSSHPIDNQNEVHEHPRLIRTNSIEQEATTTLLSARKSPFSGGSFFNGSVTPRSAAAAVDECFSKTNFTSSWPRPPSPLGPPSCSQTRCMDPRDLKLAPEFETLRDEYRFTDIDHELDSFYLDTIDTIGNDLNLLSK